MSERTKYVHVVTKKEKTRIPSTAFALALKEASCAVKK